MTLARKTGFIEVEGGKLYYEESGTGHPLVLVHAGVADHTMWDEQFDEFAQHYRVIRYDARGFGKSVSQSVKFANRQDLYDLLQFLGVDKTHVVGLSRGGQIALDFTLEHPEKVAGLVITASGPGGFNFEPTADQKADYDRQMERFDEAEKLEDSGDTAALVNAEVAIWVDGFGRDPNEVNPGVRDRIHAAITNNYAVHGDFNAGGTPLDPPGAKRLHEINVPTLIIYGTSDTLFIQAAGDFLAANIAGAKKIVYPRVAHMVNMEKPTEFNRDVLDFLGQL